ncbi:15-hydroxyprostaglandin dehydrogenase [NAD(+)]-like [Anticarsia gemmatalis]|uniref:15-hydroxyprostaglandin dehydrogenase [NAD(+)]-like n=1 Tax=Anticarsia gemmatalis TaxID=129554 RepID=UPI003F75EDF7
MAMEWKDKVVLITGAAKGIGATVVRMALEEGAQHITILDVDKENGVALQNELNTKYGDEKVQFAYCDVTNEEQLKSNFEAVLGDKSRNYVVINNAGILNDSLRLYRKEIEINVTALVTGNLLALDLMRKDKGGNGGTIINMSSVVALWPSPFTPIYNATKSAVLMFSMNLGADDYYKRTDIRVLTICFGVTDTGLVALENMESFDPEMQSRFNEPLNALPAQKVESAAQGVINMFKQGSSASVWIANADKPVEDITDVVKKGYEILSSPIFK